MLNLRILPENFTFTDHIEIINAGLLAVTGYNIGHSDGYFAICTGIAYAIGKKIVELAKAKESEIKLKAAQSVQDNVNQPGNQPGAIPS